MYILKRRYKRCIIYLMKTTSKMTTQCSGRIRNCLNNTFICVLINLVYKYIHALSTFVNNKILLFHSRFDYSVPFLQWALTPPGFFRDWHVGVRNIKNNALMGCITAVPVQVRVYDKVEKMAEINFLCVHKKLRYIVCVCMYVCYNVPYIYY